MRNLLVAFSLSLALSNMTACDDSSEPSFFFTYTLPDASIQVTLVVHEEECSVVALAYKREEACSGRYISPRYYRSMDKSRYQSVKALFTDDLISAYRAEAASKTCLPMQECWGEGHSYVKMNETRIVSICLETPHSDEMGRMYAVMRETANWCEHSRLCGGSLAGAEPCGTPEELGIPTF